VLLRTRKPRHARLSKAAPVLAVGGLAAAALAGLETTASAATSNDFARLRACESSGNYRAATGNGFYGAYQFDLQTWHGLGLSGRPSDASSATQDAAAARLQAARGWQPWPSCSRQLGLTGGGDGGGRAFTVAASRSRPVTVHPAIGHAAVRPAVAPRFGGHVLSVADLSARRADVGAWQARMVARGWDLAVDGRFGPKTAAVATRFAAEKRLHTARHGTVDAAVWSAAWLLPVS